MAAVLGHNYSVVLLLIKGRLSGGKAMATAGGALFFYRWQLLILALVIALLFISTSGYILLGQLGVIVLLPLISYLYFPADFPFIATLAILVLLKHFPRIKNLIQGKEPKWFYKINS